MIIQIEPWIDELEAKYLQKVTENGFVTEYNLTKQFEEAFSKYTNSKQAVAYTNGTMALYAALKAVGVGPGDEVIVPNMTFVATANAVHLTGAMPIFVDIEKEFLGLDPELTQASITASTKAIVPVHLYGRIGRIEELLAIAKKNDIFLIEDAAQGVGVFKKDKHAGTFGDIGILSFYGNKTMTCGEGGLIITNSKQYANYCYALKNHGRMKKGTFIHEEIGYNFAFTEMQAAIGLAQFEKLPTILERKKEIFTTYQNQLRDIEEITLLSGDKDQQCVYWFTSMLVPNAAKLADYLEKNGVQTRRFFYPLSLQPCFEKNEAIARANAGAFPVSEGIYNQGISLPSSHILTIEEQTVVISKVLDFFRNGSA